MRRRYAYGLVALLALSAVTYPVIYSVYAGTITGTGPFVCPPLIPCSNSQPVSLNCASFCVVDIQNSAFNPAVINVTQGSVVEWVNLDPNPHTVTEFNLTWNSGFIPPGGHFILNFTDIPPGAYNYQCEIHPFMIGEIFVLPSGSS